MLSQPPAVLISQSTIAARLAELGERISADHAAADSLLLVGVLRGAFMFLADLARHIRVPTQVDFIALASYNDDASHSGEVRLIMDVRQPIEGKHVLIVEDIVDSGLTLQYLRRNLQARNPASVEVCALLVRQGLQATDPQLRYVGFVIPPDFVVGYGLDVAEEYRNLPYVCTYLG